MQVHSLFATLFAFLAFVAPLTSFALVISTPSHITQANVTIQCTSEATDLRGPLSLFLTRNDTKQLLAQNVEAAPGISSMQMEVAIPAGVSGNGWSILAVTGDKFVGQSPEFNVDVVALASSPQSTSTSVAIAAGVIGGIAAIACILLLVFLRVRHNRQRREAQGPTFDVELGLHQPRHQETFSSTATITTIDTQKINFEAEKEEWETQLEAQFARARAGTPAPRGPTPDPQAVVSQPQRAVTRPRF